MNHSMRRGRTASFILLGVVLAACSTPGVDLTATTAPRPTVKVTPTPAPTAVPLAISKVSVTDSVAAGDAASLAISTADAAQCTIKVTYDSGPSQASGLDAQTADASGKATWTWTVGRTTKAGTWPIEITCFKGERTGRLSLTFRVR